MSQTQSDVLMYYNMDSRNNLFEFPVVSNVKSFSYSSIELYFLLKQIYNHEPELIELIISYIGIKNNIYSWTKFIFNIDLKVCEIKTIKQIYPFRIDDIKYSISVINKYFIKLKTQTPRERFLGNTYGICYYENPNYNYFKNKISLIKTIWFFNIINKNVEIKILMTLYCDLFEQSKDYIRNINKENLKDDCYIEILNGMETQYNKIFELFMKLINKKVNNCYFW